MQLGGGLDVEAGAFCHRAARGLDEVLAQVAWLNVSQWSQLEPDRSNSPRAFAPGHLFDLPEQSTQ